MWNYRLIKTETGGEDLLSIHEVYYTESGEIDAWSEKPIAISGETIGDVIVHVKAQSRALYKPMLVERVVDGAEVLVELEKPSKLRRYREKMEAKLE